MIIVGYVERVVNEFSCRGDDEVRLGVCEGCEGGRDQRPQLNGSRNDLLDRDAAFSLDQTATVSNALCCLRLTSGAALVMGRLRVGVDSEHSASTVARASGLRSR